MLLDLLMLAVMFWLGWMLRGIVILARMSSKPEEMIDILNKIRRINEGKAPEDDTVSAKDGIEIRIERVGDMLYAYAKENDEFIAQGPNMTTLLEVAAERFPQRRFFGVIEKDNPAKEIA